MIADDESAARKLIGHFLNEEVDFEVIAECGDGLETLETIQKRKPDLVFLDIEMPEISGIELISQLENPLPVIIFITAYNEYAVKAFEENALDYILKPFDQGRFQKTLGRIRNHLSKPVESTSIDNILAAFQGLVDKKGGNRYLKKISCKNKGTIKFVPVDDILWIESEGSFCKLHLAESFELTNLSIKRLEDLLDPSTHLRIHKSHMVNIDQIETIEPYFHGEYMVNLNGGQTLKLSRGYKSRLESILNQYK